MNNINTTPFGAAEHCALDNWAAEYAKKLFVSEAAKRTEDINNEKIAREAADNAEIQARKAADNAEIQAREAADNAEMQARAAADAALDNKKVNRNEYATETKAGIVTLHRGSANNSGLLVGSKGELAVNISPDGRYGLTRDGVGQIKTFAASLDEAKAGKDAYKPMTPSIMEAYFAWRILAERSLWQLGDAALEDKINKIVAASKYSTTPQRIDTWIDGTPIWRIAFQREITEEERTNKTVYIDLPIYDKNYVNVLNAWGQLMAYSPGAVDDEPMRYANDITFTSELIANTAFTGVYGWIEFAAPVSNMKNPYYDPDTSVDMNPGQDEGGDQIGDEAGGENSGGNSGDDITFPDPGGDENDNITE